MKRCGFFVLLMLAVAVSVGAQQDVTVQETQAGTVVSLELETVSAWDAQAWKGLKIDGAAVDVRDFSLLDRKFMESVSVETFGYFVSGTPLSDLETLDFLPVPTDFGNTNEQTVFNPVAPCRVIDTRNAGGAFAPGETRSYTIGGVANYTSIGGNAAGCGIPGSEGLLFTNERVRAYAFNVVAVNATGAGNLKVWPQNQAEPGASALNFQSLAPALNVANGIIVQNCDDTGSLFPANPLCPSGDISIKASVSQVDVVVDVVGYFSRADSEDVTGTIVSSLQSSDVTLAAAGTCVQVTSVTISNPRDVSTTVACFASADLDIDYNGSIVGYGQIIIRDTSAACGTGEDQDDMANVGILSNEVCCLNRSASVHQTFSIPANSSDTFYLNARASNTSGGHVDYGRLTCMLGL